MTILVIPFSAKYDTQVSESQAEDCFKSYKLKAWGLRYELFQMINWGFNLRISIDYFVISKEGLRMYIIWLISHLNALNSLHDWQSIGNSIRKRSFRWRLWRELVGYFDVTFVVSFLVGCGTGVIFRCLRYCDRSWLMGCVEIVEWELERLMGMKLRLCKYSDDGTSIEGNSQL